MSILDYPPAEWRLISSPAAPGAWNMALDEAIFAASLRGEVPPTLRFYTWDPPCLSLGYAQPFADVDLPALHSLRWQYVRRPTGGRAILHTDELTYSVCGPQSEPRLAGSVLESYRVIAQGLVEGLRTLNIPAESLPKHALPAGETASGPVCFEVPSNYEITVNGQKLVGSAQSRRKGGVLQHGSLPLCGDLARITRVLTFPDQAARQVAAERLLERATTAERILGSPLDWQSAASALQNAFSKVLNLHFATCEPTPAEIDQARQLVAEKYANRAWSERL
jgi:lipoate-protein ligase A